VGSRENEGRLERHQQRGKKKDLEEQRICFKKSRTAYDSGTQRAVSRSAPDQQWGVSQDVLTESGGGEGKRRVVCRVTPRLQLETWGGDKRRWHPLPRRQGTGEPSLDPEGKRSALRPRGGEKFFVGENAGGLRGGPPEGEANAIA